MTNQLRDALRVFFKEELADAIRNKLEQGHRLTKFNINPFIITALAKGVFGEASSANIAKALLYPRVFGTSLSTTFGDKMQKLCIQHLGAKASGIAGMDIEFDDKKDGGRAVVQLKAGPNTINAGDVKPIVEEIQKACRLLLQNKETDLPIFAIGITYGTPDRISAHYRKIHDHQVGRQEHIHVYVGQDFWWRLTGDESFYEDMIQLVVELFEDADYSDLFEKDVLDLAKEIEEKYFVNGKLNLKKL